jgi:uncharacterized membrane-anchored protein
MHLQCSLSVHAELNITVVICFLILFVVVKQAKEGPDMLKRIQSKRRVGKIASQAL